MKTHVVNVKSSRFGKCKLTFEGPDSPEDTNVFVYCDKDPNRTIRVWYYPYTRSWACEVQNRITRSYESFGTQMLDGTYHFSIAKDAWQFIARRVWQ